MTPLICRQCGREIPAGDSFCTGCGAPVVASSPPQDEPPVEARPSEAASSVDEELGDLRRELRQAGLFLDRLQNRVSQLEYELLLRSGHCHYLS